MTIKNNLRNRHIYVDNIVIDKKNILPNEVFELEAIIQSDNLISKDLKINLFNYNFYVFQYATGISAALALAEKVHQGQPSDLDHYLNFLKGGSSDYPVQLLKKAGVDMSSTAPVKAAIKKFDQLLGELEELLKTC